MLCHDLAKARMDITRFRSGNASEANRCVLVVEDDPLTQERLETMIERAGYSVTSVSSMQQAREATAAIFFPIVIIDRLLGDGDGIALCSDLRKRVSQSRAFLLVFSVLDSPQQIAEGMRAGADAYLSKRTSDAELLIYLDAATRISKLNKS
jgi:DNA-binding response OmpR family regulator